jgi:serine/threonine protein kinase
MAADRVVLEQVAQLVAPPGAIVDHLGTGGFASTFKVTPGGEADLYALKIVDAAQSGSERSDRELAALQRVEHPNVVSYRGTGTVTHNGMEYRWLSMGYIDGFTLKKALDNSAAWALPQAVSFLRGVTAGAAALWAEQTAHRDLSPNNVMITADGTPVIVDLGLARHFDDETITALPTPGTPGWMSPEQVGANPTHGDWRSDQYVLGLIGYRLVTGVSPFACNNVYEAFVAPDRQTPRAPKDLNPAVPASVSDVLMRMLSRQPHRRFLRPDVLLAELDRVAATLAIVDDTLEVTPKFILAVGDNHGYAAEPGYLTALGPDRIIVEPRTDHRADDLFALVDSVSCEKLLDPMTHLARSPLAVRKKFFTELPFGKGAALQGEMAEADRRAFCTSVLDHQLAAGCEVAMAPYFYAASSEQAWVQESLRCAQVTRDLLEERALNRGGAFEPVWTTVAISHKWLSSNAERDVLMTQLTSQPIQTLHLLVHTTQASFQTLGDLSVLQGLADVLGVMRDAGVPVVLGRRGPEGLLGLAMGAAGWVIGPRGVQQNMSPHPEKKEDGGRGQDRVYVPQLFSFLTAGTYQQLLAAEPDRVALNTTFGKQLLADNPTLETVTSEQRYMLLQHNMVAARAQVAALAAEHVTSRVSHLRDLVNAASEHFGALPSLAGPGESSSFLGTWARLL